MRLAHVQNVSLYFTKILLSIGRKTSDWKVSISDHGNMSKGKGNVIVYFPKSHDLSNIPFNLLKEDLGFEDNPPENSNIGSIDYGNNDLWKAVVVRVFCGKAKFTKMKF